MKVRPAPFCVMDEIEAALDEVNVDRFAQYLRKMSGTSEVDADTMNRHVAKMVEEALRYNEV